VLHDYSSTNSWGRSVVSMEMAPSAGTEGADQISTSRSKAILGDTLNIDPRMARPKHRRGPAVYWVLCLIIAVSLVVGCFISLEAGVATATTLAVSLLPNPYRR